MATYIRKLKDASGNYVSPAVRSTGVYLENNSTLSLLTFYPVGSIYQSFNEASPASLFGGSWEKLENTFLYGSGTKSVGDTGGEEKHTLAVSEMPSHTHTAYDPNNYDSIRLIGDSSENNAVSNTQVPAMEYTSEVRWHYTLIWATSSTGGDQAHNNMPPYTTINIWKRVA